VRSRAVGRRSLRSLVPPYGCPRGVGWVKAAAAADPRGDDANAAWVCARGLAGPTLRCYAVG